MAFPRSPISERFSLFMEKYRNKHGLRLAELARRMEISTSYLCALQCASRPMTKEMVKKFEERVYPNLKEEEKAELQDILEHMPYSFNTSCLTDKADPINHKLFKRMLTLMSEGTEEQRQAALEALERLD